MATTEERLAALEAKLAALTATTPTEYYTHQYSGEEIDAAVGRALTGGALDTSVTNVSNQLGTFVRPNLLDNWYFGRPVDQRGGYVVYAGANLYSDASCTTIAGQVSDGPYAARAISAICVSFTSNATYYCKIGDTGVVRGYTGNGYTVDRWKIDINTGSGVSINNGLTIKNAGSYIGQYFDRLFDSLDGIPITGSIILSSGHLLTGTLIYKSIINQSQIFFSDSAGGVSMYVNALSNTLTQVELATLKDNVSILAAKLELGPTQTLAHREGDKWVLNEVPEYGEQLRRCQRYFVYFSKFTAVSGRAANANSCQFMVPVPVTMRDKPVISDSDVANWRVQDASGKYITITGIHAYPAGVQPSYSTMFVDSASAFTPGAVYMLARTDAAGPVSLSADL